MQCGRLTPLNPIDGYGVRFSDSHKTKVSTCGAKNQAHNEHMFTMPLTTRQQQILSFIEGYVATHSYSPTFREIQAHFKFKSVSGVAVHLRLMAQKGVVKLSAGHAGALQLTNPPSPWREVPIFGSIPAGFPTDQTQGDEGCLKVDLESLKIPKGARVFALRIRGDSMTGAGILNGDTVIFEYRGGAQNGDIVAALVDGETTLKRYVSQGGKMFLKAENIRYKNIIPANELVIQGVMIGLWRTR